MKKLITLLSLLTVFASLTFADIHPRYRNLEFGFDAKFSAQQNLLTIDDIMKETINIDFTEMSKGLGKKDFAISTNNTADAYVDLKIAFLTFGIYVDLFDLTAEFSLSKEFFKLLGEGNRLDEPMDFYIGSRFEAFSDIYVPVGVDLGKLKFTVGPSLFIPLFYMPNTKAGVTFNAKSNGEIDFTGSAKANIYTVFPMSTPGDNSLPMPDPQEILQNFGDYFNFAGFDIMGSAEYELFDNLDVGAYIHLPLVPGRLDYALEAEVKYDNSIPNVADLLLSGDDSSDDGNSTGGDGPGNNSNSLLGEPEVTSTVKSNAGYKVNRPFRLGAEASFRPLGNWFAIRPSFGVAARNPFGKDFKWGENFYAEYSLNIDMRLIYIFCLSFTTSYQNEIYIQEAGFGFNFKVFELTANIASSGTSLAKSFGLGGVMAKVSLKMGF